MSEGLNFSCKLFDRHSEFTAATETGRSLTLRQTYIKIYVSCDSLFFFFCNFIALIDLELGH